jgi:hypothetical protein
MKLLITWLGAASVRLEINPVEQPICHNANKPKGLSARSHCLERRCGGGVIESDDARSPSKAGAVICMPTLFVRPAASVYVHLLITI